MRMSTLSINAMAVLLGMLLSCSVCIAQSPLPLSHIQLTPSNGSILDGNIIYYQRESAEFLLEADADCHAFVFMVSPQGEISLIFPNKAQPFNSISASRHVRVPEGDHRQSVGIKTGWALLVAVASDDPSWAYSLNELNAPKVWDVGSFGPWKGAVREGPATPEGDYAIPSSASPRGSETRDALRDEMNDRSAAKASQAAEAILSKAQSAVEGRFAFAKQSFFVASKAYSESPAAVYDERAGEDGSYSWEVFYSDLYPYGYWDYMVGFGYVWRPYHVGVGWAPFYHGRWVFTIHGWTWVSYEPWGWIAYHYGHWVMTHRWGWVWVPGYVWSPGRVRWYGSHHRVAWRPEPLPSAMENAIRDQIELDTPTLVVPREHLMADNVQKYAEVEELRPDGASLVAADGARLERLLDATPDRQKTLALGEVKPLELKYVDTLPSRSPLGGFSRVETDRVEIPQPRLAPGPRKPDRLLYPWGYPRRYPSATPDDLRRRRPETVEPEKAKTPEPKKAEPEKAKPKPKKRRTKPEKVGPKKADKD